MDKIDKKVDYMGLKCPLPVLKARRELEKMDKNQILEIIADDPAAKLDFTHFCEVSNYELIKTTESNSKIIVLIKKVN